MKNEELRMKNERHGKLMKNDEWRVKNFERFPILNSTFLIEASGEAQWKSF
jgi:hypothetical protein